MSNKKKEVACPECKISGYVLARKDAYADHKIYIDSSSNSGDVCSTSWVHTDTAIMDETQAYECFKCNSELTEESIEEFNNVIL